ncbi:MAG: hypothetical protein GXC72_03660 [Chitinophagaceae bacterium]|jgi:hypothetical protein|nr:hypothetical protein [Chitinophagaceae bacterium]
MKGLLKKYVVLLLLLSFANIVTARPGGYFLNVKVSAEADELQYNKTESFTLIEFLLESVHGLSDNIPNNEEQGIHYSIFRTNGKISSLRAPAEKKPFASFAISPVPPMLSAGSDPIPSRQLSPAPNGEVYSFLFRLTPF